MNMTPKFGWCQLSWLAPPTGICNISRRFGVAVLAPRTRSGNHPVSSHAWAKAPAWICR